MDDQGEVTSMEYHPISPAGWAYLRKDLTARRILKGLRSPMLISVLRNSPGTLAMLDKALRAQGRTLQPPQTRTEP